MLLLPRWSPKGQEKRNLGAGKLWMLTVLHLYIVTEAFKWPLFWSLVYHQERGLPAFSIFTWLFFVSHWLYPFPNSDAIHPSFSQDMVTESYRALFSHGGPFHSLMLSWWKQFCLPVGFSRFEPSLGNTLLCPMSPFCGICLLPKAFRLFQELYQSYRNPLYQCSGCFDLVLSWCGTRWFEAATPDTSSEVQELTVSGTITMPCENVGWLFLESRT